MTEREFRKIEKTLIERIENTGEDTPEHKAAINDLLKIVEQHEKNRHQMMDERLEKEKLDKQVTLEREKMDRQEKLEKEKMHADKIMRRWSLLGNILSGFGGIAGALLTTIVGYKLFDKQATKAYKFEETGTISSFTSRQVMSGLKPPKH